MKKAIRRLKRDRNAVHTGVTEMMRDQNARMKNLSEAIRDLLVRHAREYRIFAFKLEEAQRLLKLEKEKTEAQQKAIVAQEGVIEDLQDKVGAFIVKLRITDAELEAANGQIEALTQSEAECLQTIQQLETVVLQLRDDQASHIKAIEKLQFSAERYQSELQLQYARRELSLEMMSQPIVVFTSHPQRMRLVVSAQESSAGSSRPPSTTVARVFVPRSTSRSGASKPPVKEESSSHGTVICSGTPFPKDQQPPMASAAPGLTPSEEFAPKREIPVKVYAEPLHFQQTDVNMRYMAGLEKRIHLLERQVLVRNLALHDERNRVQVANQLLFKAGLANQKAIREVKKLTIMHDRARSGLAKAVAMITERGQEVDVLKRKVRNFQALAGRIATNQSTDTSEPVDANTVLARLIVSSKDEPLLARMAQEEVQSMRRVEEARSRYIQAEQQKILGALDAMCFLTQSVAEPTRPTIRVSTVKQTKVTRRQHSPTGSRQSRTRTSSRLTTKVLL
jgi:hypothetical protein